MECVLVVQREWAVMYHSMCFRITKTVTAHCFWTLKAHHYKWPLTVFVPLKHILWYMTAHSLCTYNHIQLYMTAHSLCTPITHTIVHDRSQSLHPYSTYYYIWPPTVFVPVKHVLLCMTTHCLFTTKHVLLCMTTPCLRTPKTHTIINYLSLSLFP